MPSIRAAGLASPLGGASAAAAAFRAGVSRFEPIPDVSVMFRGDEEPSPVRGSALAAATFGFSGVGRLVALLAEALVDLGTTELDARAAAGLRACVALPDPDVRGIALERDHEADNPADPDERLRRLGERVTSLAAKAVGFPFPRGPAVSFHGGGHTAFAQATAAAQAALARGEATATLVCAVDSLVDPLALQLLAAAGRVKNDATPTGFVPGEAAVALLLTPDRDGARVAIAEVAAGIEPNPLDGDRPADGRALLACAQRALGGAAGAVQVVVSDHDGETHRARELGTLLALVRGPLRRLAEVPAWLPATSFGNTGAASGALAACLAVRAHARGRLPGGAALILSSDDAGPRAAVALRVPAAKGR
jgi:hypothetical protein